MAEIPTKAELIAEIRGEWALLDALVRQLSEAQLTAMGTLGPWSVKDMLAHVSAWEKVLLDRLEAALTGAAAQYPPILSEDDVHRTNAQFFAESQGRTLQEVLAESQALFAQVLAAVEAWDEAALPHPMPLDFPLDGLIAWQIIRANTSDHYQEHRLALESWLKGAGQA